MSAGEGPALRRVEEEWRGRPGRASPFAAATEVYRMVRVLAAEVDALRDELALAAEAPRKPKKNAVPA